ncbi:DUF1697 domain-containing protein [Aeoliella sp. ICT_H6.2]|uniref:DUF1697 domain-containing protein n=1 Tax=Aeoliella straminimaris TaxID=2954799 RepID=A0A9X2JHJ8_9BACT|nr:DUF1697 domain-containing protein [Aeoliella straminimaris]MCO6046120.1 DUF1697 domain-containing protein [Aeoliella straminimaris]
MPNSRHLALLRGVNVGGRNLIAKDELRQCFETIGFTAVRTYIQSGNILFRSDSSALRELTKRVEAALSERFDYQAQAVVLSHAKYQAAVAAAPPAWGQDAACKHYAIFPVGGITPQKVLAQLPEPDAGIETVTVGPGVLLWSVDNRRQPRSTYARLSRHQLYKQLTIRNSNTTFKLLELFSEI